MVLGLRAKTRRGPNVQVEYLIHVQEIKPWPPTQSLKNLRSVLIQWENGDRNSGSTSSVAPSVDDGKIEFNESFKLPAVLSRDMSVKNGDVDVFHKNLLEFNLYEPRRDKTLKGQLLGTAIVDLADYVVIHEITNVSVPMNCTRSFRNTAQPVLYLRIQSYDKVRSNSSLRGRLAKEASLDKNGGDSVSALMSEEYADEAEVASLADDDVSSHSSLTASSAHASSGGSPSHNKEIGTGRGKDFTEMGTDKQELDLKLAHQRSDTKIVKESNDNSKYGSSLGASVEVSSDHKSPNNAPASLSDNSDLESESNSAKSFASGPVNVSGNHDTESDAPALNRNRFKQVKSVRSPMDSARSNGLPGGGSGAPMKHEAKIYPVDKGSASANTKAQELEQRIKMLEGELREAAGIEVSLYSVVAEHGSSVNKVHAPARRLSRLYLQASKGMRRANAAQRAVSGLVVVAKACGNDVPRLTFWLSNCFVLRAIVSEAFVNELLPISAGTSSEHSGAKGMSKKPASLKWKVTSSEKKGAKDFLGRGVEDLEDPHAFISALEKVESWIFSRIIESVWWQTLTPHMQSSAAKAIDKVVDSGTKRSYKRTSSSADQGQVNFSLDLWKKAFKDACERLCPVRAGGHECGCLPVLSKLIMEQCVVRLDVAMFNAVLRESADDIPTDPVSDPISDSKVLPVQAGRSSFGAGAQLKNAIGNWSRWLTDLFGLDDDDAPEDDDYDNDDQIHKHDSSFRSFHLLKSLSDLMMLPKDMLLSESIRREVCPTFGAPLIKRVLENFVPDEFCPDPIPDAVFVALDSEDALAEGGSTMNFPFPAPAVSYYPPPASSLTIVTNRGMGQGSQSELRRSTSVLRRSNTSDDELDELDSPLNSILGDNLQASPAQMRQNRKVLQNHGKHAVRYQLLRQVWDKEHEF